MTEQQKPTMQVEPDMGQPKKVESNITQNDLMNIFALPAVFVDHFFAGNSQGFVRLTMAEKSMGIEGSPAIPRMTAILTLHGVKTLHGLLGNIISQLEAQNKAPEREKLN